MKKQSGFFVFMLVSCLFSPSLVTAAPLDHDDLVGSYEVTETVDRAAQEGNAGDLANENLEIADNQQGSDAGLEEHNGWKKLRDIGSSLIKFPRILLVGDSSSAGALSYGMSSHSDTGLSRFFSELGYGGYSTDNVITVGMVNTDIPNIDLVEKIQNMLYARGALVRGDLSILYNNLSNISQLYEGVVTLDTANLLTRQNFETLLKYPQYSRERANALSMLNNAGMLTDSNWNTLSTQDGGLIEEAAKALVLSVQGENRQKQPTSTANYDADSGSAQVPAIISESCYLGEIDSATIQEIKGHVDRLSETFNNTLLQAETINGKELKDLTIEALKYLKEVRVDAMYNTVMHNGDQADDFRETTKDHLRVIYNRFLEKKAKLLERKGEYEMICRNAGDSACDTFDLDCGVLDLVINRIQGVFNSPLKVTTGELRQKLLQGELEEHLRVLKRAITDLPDNQRVFPTCFISYAWGHSGHEQWVHNLAVHLRVAGLTVRLDVVDNKFNSLLPFLDRITTDDYVIVVGTPEYRKKYEKSMTQGGHVVGAEARMIVAKSIKNPQSIVKVLLAGTHSDSFPPVIGEGLFGPAFTVSSEYFTSFFTVLEQLYQSRPEILKIIKDIQTKFDNSAKVIRNMKPDEVEKESESHGPSMTKDLIAKHVNQISNMEIDDDAQEARDGMSQYESNDRNPGSARPLYSQPTNSGDNGESPRGGSRSIVSGNSSVDRIHGVNWTGEDHSLSIEGGGDDADFIERVIANRRPLQSLPSRDISAVTGNSHVGEISNVQMKGLNASTHITINNYSSSKGKKNIW